MTPRGNNKAVVRQAVDLRPEVLLVPESTFRGRCIFVLTELTDGEIQVLERLDLLVRVVIEVQFCKLKSGEVFGLF